MAEGRRIIYDEEDEEIYKNLRYSSGPLKNSSILDLFSLALIYGKKQGIRTKLGKNARGRVRGSTLDSSNVRYLMMALAIEEEGTIDILSDENAYFTIAEEYAKTGILLLQSEYIEKGDELIDDMEWEMIEYYDAHRFDELQE